MTAQQKALIAAICVLGLAECAIQVIDHQTIRYFLKPLVMLFIIYRIHTVPDVKTKTFTVLTKYGLCISIIGDILLMFKNQFIFECGTLAFLVAHLIYIAGNFTAGVSGPSKSSELPYVLALLLYSAVAYQAYDLWDKFPNKLLFISYGLVLATMVVSAGFRFNRTTWRSFLLAAVGAILFGVSDNLIATFKFNKYKTSWGQAVIMLTYYLAQLMICEGAIEHDRKYGIKDQKKAS